MPTVPPRLISPVIRGCPPGISPGPVIPVSQLAPALSNSLAARSGGVRLSPRNSPPIWDGIDSVSASCLIRQMRLSNGPAFPQTLRFSPIQSERWRKRSMAANKRACWRTGAVALGRQQSGRQTRAASVGSATRKRDVTNGPSHVCRAQLQLPRNLFERPAQSCGPRKSVTA